MHCATYHHRARLPTSPHSDDELKDKEVCSSHGFHNSHLSDRTPVLLTPPGSAKTSIDLSANTSHELLSNDSQNVLDRVRAFIEFKPAEPLVT